MSLRHPSPVTRRLLKIASLGLAGLLAGLLSGCSGSTVAQLFQPHIDANWQTASTYASATASMPPRSALRSAHIHSCNAGAPRDLRITAPRGHVSHHHTL